MNKGVQVSCPGSCGELFQGFIGETEYLVTLPIRLFNTVTLNPHPVNQFPDCPKAKQAFDLTCDYFAIPEAARPVVQVKLEQRLPISKGMSSSTADLTAMVYATSLLLQQDICEHQVARICCQIEKTDSLVFSQLSLMASSTGEVLFQANWQPEMQVLVLEPDETIDTARFHQQRSLGKARSQSTDYQKLVQQFKEAVAEKSLKKLGQVSTASSHLNQQLLAKPCFQELVALVDQFDLLGMMVAHSGTVIGFLLEPEEEFPQEMLAYLKAPTISHVYPNYYLTKSTFGGPRIKQTKQFISNRDQQGKR